MVEIGAKTYAKALFEVALELEKLDQFHQELEFMLETFVKYPEFFELYKTPRISVDEKKKIMAQVFGDKLSVEVMNLMKILLDKGRSRIVESMIAEYRRLANEHNKIVEAVAVTVVPMKDEDRAALEEKLSKTTGKKIILKNQIDPDIVGGILVKIGDKVIDGTIRSRLNRLKENLAQIIV